MPLVVRVHQPGGPEALRLEDIEIRPPAPGELRIRVEAIGLNRSDMIYCRGHHPTPMQLPSLFGSEAAGRVEAIGADVHGFALNDAVTILPRMRPEYGTCGALILAPADWVIHHPAHLTMPQAAGLLAPYLTAYGGLIETGKLAAGGTVVLPAAASSVGLAAIHIARMAGATAIALTRQPDKLPQLIAAGAHHALLSGSPDLPATVHRLTNGQGAALVFDPVGGSGVPALARCLGLNGAYVLYGVLSGEPTLYPVAESFARPLTMQSYRLSDDRAVLQPSLHAILAGVRAGTLPPIAGPRFPLAEIADAYRLMESNRHVGKIVVTVP
jgi:NADPH:quinone reductase-like Zn-dependent oxidoreductase